MPNWCMNTLTIEGETEEVDRLVEHVECEEQVFSIEEYFPTPEELHGLSAPNGVIPLRDETEEEYEARKARRAELIEKYNAPDWYFWRNQNWSVKWDVTNVTSSITVDRESGESRAVYVFETPWGPPINAIERLSALYPNLYMALSFDEPGMDFGGYMIFKNGEELDCGDGGSRISSWEEISQDVLENTRYYQAKLAEEAESAESDETAEEKAEPEKEVV